MYLSSPVYLFPTTLLITKRFRWKNQTKKVSIDSQFATHTISSSIPLFKTKNEHDFPQLANVVCLSLAILTRRENQIVEYQYVTYWNGLSVSDCSRPRRNRDVVVSFTSFRIRYVTRRERMSVADNSYPSQFNTNFILAVVP